jgi:hypothetical protein
METLGSLYKQILEQAQQGQRTLARDPFDKAGYPHADKSEEVLLKESFERVSTQLKLDFAQGIARNFVDPIVRDVCSYVPNTEACFALLSGGNWNQIKPDTVQHTVETAWGELLGWLKGQGLILHISERSEAYGVRRFIVLQALVDTADNREVEKSDAVRYVAPGVPRFIN